MMDADLQGLKDRLEISELRSKYCWYMTRRDIERVVDLYTDDLLFEVQMKDARVTVNGPDELRAFFSNSSPGGYTIPTIHNEVTFIDGEEARGVCCMEVRWSDPDVPFISGYYHDKFRKVGGRWRFSERRYYRYFPNFERSGLNLDGTAEVAAGAATTVS